MRIRPAVAVAGLLLCPASGPAATLLDCDLPATPYVATQYLDPPPPQCLPGGPTGNFLRLADTTVVNRNAIAFDLSDPGAHELIVADFDFRMRPRTVRERADGFGLTLLSTAQFGASGPVGGGSEEANHTASLGIGFDIHEGPGDLNHNHVSVHWNATRLAEFDATGAIDLANTYFNHARIVVRAGGTSPDVTVILTPCGGPPITVVDRFAVPGLAPYEARVQLMARSGGESALHDFDNLSVQFLGSSQGVVSLVRRTHAVVETEGSAQVQVQRTGDVQGTAGVTLSTAGGSATAGTDFLATSVVITFAPGETLQTVAIPLVDDGAFEGDETILVRLENPTGGLAVGGPGEGRVTIVDDESGRASGHWGEVVCLPVLPIHTTLLPQGEVMFWRGEEAQAMAMGGDQPFRWDPVSGAIRPLATAGYDLFCAGHTVAADGRVFVTGGHAGDDIGLPDASFYDPFTDTWEHLPDMNAGRWYPTNTVLPNGDLLVTAGSISVAQMNDLPQVWDVRAHAWRDLTGAVLGEPDLFRYYPWMHVIGEGRVFCAGWQQATYELDPRGAGAWRFVANSGYGIRDYGSSVMYEHGKVLIVGGNPHDSGVPPTIPPSASTEVIDLNQPNPAWRFVTPMTLPRRHLNATLLPDGSVLATGGSSSVGFNSPNAPALTAERWDPATETWTTLAAQTVPRLYHSVALLLPDGRVMSGAGGRPSPPGHLHQKNAEIFSPPYLFRGPRPVIAAAPDSLKYGEAFLLATPDRATIGAVRLMGLSSVTHAFNSGQRGVPLDFTVVLGGLWVSVPVDSARCPPGYYMMFLVNESGVPSQAQFVHVSGPPQTGAGPPGGTRLAIHGTLPQPAVGGLQIWLTLAADAPATLTLFDVTGRAIGDPEEVGHLGAGSHLVTPRAVPGRSGVYLARLTQNGWSVARRILVLR